jgi:hypothetical protein
MRKEQENKKEELASVIKDMIDKGSEGVTTLSKDPEAKYESITEKEPGKDK